GSEEILLNELATIGTKEVVVDSNFDSNLRKKIEERIEAIISIEENIDYDHEFNNVLAKLSNEKLQTTAIRLLHYLKKTQKRSLDHLQPFSEYEVNQYMKLDYYSKRNLELTESIR